MAGETEVIFWKGGNWRGKRYCPNGRVLLPLAPGPIVEMPTPNPNRSENYNISGMAEGIAVVSMESDSTEESNEDFYYNYDDVVPLEEAIARQEQQDPPPQRTYYHADTIQPVSMGEWMLFGDRHGRLNNHQWRKRLHNGVRSVSCACKKSLLFVSRQE